MIDPNNIIDFNRTDAELEELILFLIAVAGKGADRTSKLIWQAFHAGKDKYSPFTYIRALDQVGEGGVRELLETLKIGNYTRLTRAFLEIAHSGMNLRTCTKEDLMKIHGVGRKSASCFLAWTRRGEKVAMLDTHLLKYLRYWQETYTVYPKGHPEHNPFSASTLLHGITIPKSTPSSKKLYDRLEQAYLAICRTLYKDPTEYDLEVWRYYSNGLDKKK